MRARSTVLLLAAALAACARRAPPPDLSLEPGPLLAQVREAAARVVSVRGAARIRVKGQGRVAVPAFVAAEKPDRLHLEALDFFGNPAAVLVAASGRLAIYDARQRTHYRGAATPENVARLVTLALAPEELVAILCGAPLLAGEAVRAEPGRGHVTLEIRDGSRTTNVRVISGAAVARAAVRRGGGSGYDVANGDPLNLDGTSLPADVALSSDRPPVRIELAWTDDVEANPQLDAALFHMDPPAGARVVDLDAAEPAAPPSPFLEAVPDGTGRFH